MSADNYIYVGKEFPIYYVQHCFASDERPSIRRGIPFSTLAEALDKATAMDLDLQCEYGIRHSSHVEWEIKNGRTN